MKSTTIVCLHCKKSFEISDAIQHQIEGELTKAKTEQSAALRKEFNSHLEARTKQAVQSAVAEANKSAEFLLAKERQAAKSAMQGEKQLREHMAALLEELSQAKKAKEDAHLAARKEMLDKEGEIREEAAKRASEDFNTKIREQEETINKLREQLTTAKQVAEQGSQQMQGEILEMDIEHGLRANFPFDTINEVRKGERGSDIRQTVNEQFYQNCGLILWECKNAKTYQAGWLGKLKDELAAERAQIGVIVFSPTGGGGEDFKQLADNVWLVKPRYAMMLATFLREVCVRVAIANRNAEGKDVKVEMIYNYLTGGEFANRIRYVIEAYDEMAKQLDNEKKQAQKRWAAQEKILQKVTGSLYGISGDLQGIAGREIVALPMIDDDNEEA
ncbi:MAG: DUF2130 domain-containing protein [Defluviitaleaceae bacterium]|nr:DUF2130 domain-containing protein [Defluviitaleaceae bacterium]